MVLLTMVGRVNDGLPLATSIEGDEQAQQNMDKYRQQGKLLFRKLKPDSPNKCTLQGDQYVFHYSIDQGACFLCVCEKEFPAKVAFGFLDDIGRQFTKEYGQQIATAAQADQFMEFENYIKTTRNNFVGRSAQLAAANSELQDVTRIMVQNIEDIIGRGESLNSLEEKANKLSAVSKQFKYDSQVLYYWQAHRTEICVVIFVIIFLLLYLLRDYWWPGERKEKQKQ